MSLSAAPARLSAAITLWTRLLFSATASSTVGATVCTPTENVKRSGASVARPVPVTVTLSDQGIGWGGSATAPTAINTAMTVMRNLFMQPPRLLLPAPMAEPNDKVPGQAAGRYYVDSQCIDCDLCRET